MKKKNLRFMVQGAAIAALYVALTFFSSLFGLSGGVIQLRLSEALCILPVFTPAAIPGLFAGCALANILTGSLFPDIVFGSIATLLGAVFTRIFRRNRFLALLSPIAANTLIIPFVLKYSYGFQGSVLYFVLTVGTGEVLSCGVLGCILLKALEARKNLFK